jgi:hypothetical protein
MNKAVQCYMQPAFLICVAVLATAAGGMSLMKSYFKLWLEKEPIALKKSLDNLDESRLGPFVVKQEKKIQSNDIVDSLGTSDYIQWVLTDKEAKPDDPAGTFMLFITYYGKADSVPHVPEECYTGGGYRQIRSDPITFEVDRSVGDRTVPAQIPGRYVVFARTGSDPWALGSSFPVLYLFSVNGQYTNTRTEARLILGANLRGKHSYFSKIEMVFNQTRSQPDERSAIKSCGKLLTALLPVLEQDHFPDRQDLLGQ